MEKKCYCCGEIKPIDSFSLHAGMKDGRINKCKACHVEYVRRLRKSKPKEELQAIRRAEYEAALRKGSRTRNKSLDEIRSSHDPINRKINALRHFHKKRAGIKQSTEIDDFVFDEAVRLCHSRSLATGIRWEIDHIVPIGGKQFTGLHNAFNLQVVPKRWNEKKSNVRIDLFFQRFEIGY